MPAPRSLYPKRGVSDIARMDPAAVEERFGLPPSQYADYAALRGDKSDNLPNIPGVGEKTAAKWVREYGGLDGLVDNADQVPGRAGSRCGRTWPRCCSTGGSRNWCATCRWT